MRSLFAEGGAPGSDALGLEVHVRSVSTAATRFSLRQPVKGDSFKRKWLSMSGFTIGAWASRGES